MVIHGLFIVRKSFIYSYFCRWRKNTIRLIHLFFRCGNENIKSIIKDYFEINASNIDAYYFTRSNYFVDLEMKEYYVPYILQNKECTELFFYFPYMWQNEINFQDYYISNNRTPTTNIKQYTL